MFKYFKKIVLKIPKKSRLILTIIILLIIISLFAANSLKHSKNTLITETIKKGNLKVDVLGSGTLKAVRNQDIVSEVRGPDTILYLIPQGTVITETDIKHKTVLVRLDPSNLDNQLAQQEINLQDAESAYIEAKESYSMQINQNETNLQQARLNLYFARMALEEYVGKNILTKLLDKSSLTPKELLDESSSKIEKLVNSQDLAGQAYQNKQELQNSINLANKNLSQDENTLTWTKKLVKDGFATKDELSANTLTVQSDKINLEQALTSLQIFEKYDFKKQIAQLLSNYRVAKEGLLRTEATANEQLIQAKNLLVTKQASYLLTQQDLNLTKAQIAKCTITATQPGIVVYATTPPTNQPIQTGMTVFLRQPLLFIPDISRMKVKMRIPESYIAELKIGQPAKITVGAIPGVTFKGDVKKISLLPSAKWKWLNPDVNVYDVYVNIKGKNKLLKPGMISKVKILIAEKKNILLVPIPAIYSSHGKLFCNRFVNGQSITTPITIGLKNNNFAEVIKGLRQEDNVILQ
ncbi:MAG: efflux RND transporter periplasmic adaptor subunit [Candidatus Omnitrophica bacterium]|nr:efflux RND transporter periplasmic adaptor subunit [Candidatus Omnitrophota bacterium]